MSDGCDFCRLGATVEEKAYFFLCANRRVVRRFANGLLCPKCLDEASQQCDKWKPLSEVLGGQVYAKNWTPKGCPFCQCSGYETWRVVSCGEYKGKPVEEVLCIYCFVMGKLYCLVVDEYLNRQEYGIDWRAVYQHYVGEESQNDLNIAWFAARVDETMCDCRASLPDAAREEAKLLHEERR